MPSFKKDYEPLDPELIIGLRTSLHLTRTAFAQRLLVDRKTVWRWENGKAWPSQVHVRQMHTIWNFSLGVQKKLEHRKYDRRYKEKGTIK